MRMIEIKTQKAKKVCHKRKLKLEDYKHCLKQFN